MKGNRRNFPGALVRGAFTVLVALWIFLEEWVWDAMQACMAWIGKLPGVRWCEARIAELPPYAALVAFLACDEASFISGAEYVIDGATTAGMMGV